MAKKKRPAPKEYVALANIRGKGDLSYNRDDLLTAHEFQMVPKEYKKKFAKISDLSPGMLEGTEDEMKVTIQNQAIQIDMLKKEIKELKTELGQDTEAEDQTQGSAITSKTGGQSDAEKVG